MLVVAFGALAIVHQMTDDTVVTEQDIAARPAFRNMDIDMKADDGWEAWLPVSPHVFAKHFNGS